MHEGSAGIVNTYFTHIQFCSPFTIFDNDVKYFVTHRMHSDGVAVLF